MMNADDTTVRSDNIVACTLAGSFLANSYIPLFALTGDLVITVILLCYYLRRGTLRW